MRSHAESDARIHIALAGGGTGGHLFPGVAVAESLAALPADARITFVGPGGPLETRCVAARGFDYRVAPAPRPARAGWLGSLRFPFDLVTALRHASKFLREEGVSLVVGLGGYAAAPLCLAARRTRTPLVLLEQNVVPGRVTRLASRWAAVVCTSYEETAALLPRRGRVACTGTPVRREFLALHDQRLMQDRPADRPRRLAILGGSAGASILNETMPATLRSILSESPDPARRWSIVHQTGTQDREAVRAAYAGLPLDFRVEPFLDDVAGLLAGSDLAVCRAGGTTLAELAACGVPAVVVPYPHAKDDHQRKNALWYAQRGAAILVDQRGRRFEERLLDAVKTLLDDDTRRQAMSRSMRALARPRAAARIVALVERFIRTGCATPPPGEDEP